jgi:hypothetical protein
MTGCDCLQHGEEFPAVEVVSLLIPSRVCSIRSRSIPLRNFRRVVLLAIGVVRTEASIAGALRFAGPPAIS